DELVSVTIILAVVVGVVGPLVLVALVAVVLLNLKNKRRPNGKIVSIPLQTSLDDSLDHEDKNPDIIPANVCSSAAGNAEAEKTSPTTPEDGGFGSVHICASVPYPSSVYGTYLRTSRPLAAAEPQTEDLLYAELSLPSGRDQYSTATFSHCKIEPTVYTSIDLAIPGVPVSTGVVPIRSGGSGGIVASSACEVMGSGLGGSAVGVMGGSMVSLLGSNIVGQDGNMCPRNSLVMSAMCSQETMTGNLDSLAHTTPITPPYEFGRHQLTPPILPEDNKQTTVKTVLVVNHEESEV
ncbi:hypothetical protein OTU49_010146, partial [Cherax quadricarinatus]